jgi:hypothetical protein
VSAILREYIRMGRRRLKRAPCSCCENLLFPFERYCPFCGSASAPVVPSWTSLPDVEARSVLCRVDPEHRVEAAYARVLNSERSDDPEIRYCGTCGLFLRDCHTHDA